MPTSTGSRLFRFLLSLVLRLRLSVGRIALALRARFASLWRSILAFARHRGQPRIRLCANDVPKVDENPVGAHSNIPRHVKVEEEDSGTLAALPVRRPAGWRDELLKYQDPPSSDQLKPAFPATPEVGSQRYKPRKLSQSNNPSAIPAGQHTLLTALPPLPEGWGRHVHPEGSVLFYHEGLRIFTESDINDRRNCEEIMFHATTLIRQAIDMDGVTLDELTEIVLNVDDERHWHYYFVDHKNCLLFWVQSVHLRDLGTDLQRIAGYGHIRYFVEARYWYASSGSPSGMFASLVFYIDTDSNSSILYDMKLRSHCEYYPHNRALPKGVFEGLRGMLNYAKTDILTAADSSTSPFTQDELVAILDLINSLKDDKRIADPCSIWIIARLMAYFTEDQFMNFCGQPCARLNADTVLFEQQTWNRSIAFKLVNVFLLGSPNEHANRLQRVWVDGTIIQPRWKDFINRLTNELGRYPIFSTVMLAVNFSFLAVPGVVTAGSPASQIEIIICCSIVSSIGSIVFSFALSNVYSDPGLMDAGPAADVMKTLSRKRWGMVCLAMTHSLPIACLVWSITLFTVALALQIFFPKQLSMCTTLGAECFILALFGLMSYRVMKLFIGNDDIGDVDTSSESDASPKGTGHDIELGSASAKCCTLYAR